MSEETVGQQAARASLWSYAAYYGSRGLLFATTVVLAHFLTPSEFGVAGYALVVISFLEVVRDLGIGPAVVYQEDSRGAASTGFWLGLFIAAALSSLTWWLAPLAGAFFHDGRAVPVLRVLGFAFPLFALGNIHDALLTKGLAFRRRGIADAGLAISKATSSIALAAAGAGARSIVGGQLIGVGASSVIFWLLMPWRPTLHFDRSVAKRLTSYGMGSVAVEVVSRLIINADYLLIGHFLGPVALGVYTIAFRVPEMLLLDFCSALGRVLFPAYTRLRHDTPAVSRALLVTMRHLALLTVPVGVGLAFSARPFVVTVFGERWVGSVDAMRAIAVFATVLSLSYSAGDVYKAQGRVYFLSLLNAAHAALLLPALWWAAARNGTITAVGWTHATVAVVVCCAELLIVGRVLAIPHRQLLAAIAPALNAGAGMAAVMLIALRMTSDMKPLLQLVLLVAVGAASYLAILRIVHHDVVSAARTLVMHAARGR